MARGGTNQAGSRVAKIIPSADAVYACVIWYLPTPADLVSGSDTFDGIAGFEEWVVNRAAMDCLTRDRARYAELDGDNEQLRRNMVFEFAAAQGPGRRQDTETLRKRFATYVSGDWWAP